MHKKRIVAVLLAVVMVFSSCGKNAGPGADSAPEKVETSVLLKYKAMSPEEIVSSLTLEEKAAQMVQGALYNISYNDMKEHDYGSVLSKYEDLPAPTDEQWKNIVDGYQSSALSSETKIPYIYGQDSVHGVNFAYGSVIFPQNINIGAANDTGVMCGGWTYFWLGATDKEAGELILPNDNSVYKALEAVAKEKGFEVITDPNKIDACDMVLLCVGEKPYAEWLGDTEDLSIVGDMALDGNEAAIEEAKASGKPVTTLIMAGRNVLVQDYIDDWDSCIMCYLPGSEGGNAVADVLTQDAEPAGKLPMPYYSSVGQIGSGKCWHEAGWSAL